MAKQEELNPEMGQRARERREYLGIPKNEFAVKLGIGTNRVSALEREGCDSIKKTRRWAEALGMDPADLAFGPGTIHPSTPKKGKK